MAEQPHERQRPRWARRIHYLGADLQWALSAWCDFPRPIRRGTAATVAALGGHVVGIDDTIISVVNALVD